MEPAPIVSVLTVAYDTDQPHDCFADEIAIDFPSVDHLVERVRDAFLGERAGGDDTHTTEVSLSIRDATKGTVVGMEVPLRGTCTRCGGRGGTWTEPCADCRGTVDSRCRPEWPTARVSGSASTRRTRRR
jgi:DnaJ-class molecular chaperone